MISYPALIFVFIGGLLVMLLFKKQMIAMFQKKADSNYEKQIKAFENEKKLYGVPDNSPIITYTSGNAVVGIGQYLIWRSGQVLNFFPAQLRVKSKEHVVFSIAIETMNFYSEPIDTPTMSDNDVALDLPNTILIYAKNKDRYKMELAPEDLVTLQGLFPERINE
jgi:hypothetical protein